MANSGTNSTGSICGFDVGSENCYIAVAKGGGIEILLNEYSQRSTPAYVGLGEKQRDLGVDAKQKHAMNISRTFYAMKRLVGRQYNEVIHKEQDLFFPIEQATNGDVAIRVYHNGEEHVFTATQVLAMLLTKLRQISNMSVDCVINCPNYFSDGQRRALQDAACIAGLNPLRILPDMTAIGVYYGFYRVGSFNESTVVAFIDCGHYTTQIAIIHFSSKQNTNVMQVLSMESDSNLGGKHFDEVLADHFVREKKLSLSKRARLRLLAECEKLKKQMSANTNSLPISIECLYDDRDFSSRMSRAEFEELAKPYFDRIETLFKTAFVKAADNFLSLQKGAEKPAEFKVNSVETVGGAHRIQAIKKSIKDVFGLEASTTLNGDEAVARGCALQCAILSPSYKVARELEIVDLAPYTINCKYWFASEPEPQIHPLNGLFAKGDPIPFTRQITISCHSLPVIFELEYVNDSNTPTAIGQFQVTSAQSIVINKNKLKLRVKVDNSGLVGVTAASLLVDSKIEVNGETATDGTAPQVQPMETDQGQQNQNQQTETSNHGDNKEKEEKEKEPKEKPKGKTCSVDLQIEPLWIRGKLFTVELNTLKEVEANLLLADKNWKERIDARNGLEEFVYEWRGKIEEGRYDKFVDMVEKEHFLKELNAMEQWFYADEESGETQSRSVYLGKLDSLRTKFTDSIVFREQEFNNRSQCMEKLGKSLQLARKLLEVEDPVDEKKLKKLEAEVLDKEKWFEQSHHLLSSALLTASPPVTTKQIVEQNEAIESLTRPIMDELHKKKQEKQRQEEERRKKEEEEKKKQSQPQTQGEGQNQQPPSTEACDPSQTQPMEVDPQAQSN